MNIMASVYVLHHYEDFYALVDSAWTAAKMLVGEQQVDENSFVVSDDYQYAGKYRTVGELMEAWSREGQIVDIVSYLLEETTHWSLMSWTLEEQILWTKEAYGGQYPPLRFRWLPPKIKKGALHALRFSFSSQEEDFFSINFPITSHPRFKNIFHTVNFSVSLFTVPSAISPQSQEMIIVPPLAFSPTKRHIIIMFGIKLLRAVATLPFRQGRANRVYLLGSIVAGVREAKAYPIESAESIAAAVIIL